MVSGSSSNGRWFNFLGIYICTKCWRKMVGPIIKWNRKGNKLKNKLVNAGILGLGLVVGSLTTKGLVADKPEPQITIPVIVQDIHDGDTLEVSPISYIKVRLL